MKASVWPGDAIDLTPSSQTNSGTDNEAMIVLVAVYCASAILADGAKRFYNPACRDSPATALLDGGVKDLSQHNQIADLPVDMFKVLTGDLIDCLARTPFFLGQA